MPSMESSTQCESNTDQRAFQCRICGRSFMKSEHLVRHVRSHTREKPFKCPDCGNCYSRQDILKRHRRHVPCKAATAQNRSTTTKNTGQISSTGQIELQHSGNIIPVAHAGTFPTDRSDLTNSAALPLDSADKFSAPYSSTTGNQEPVLLIDPSRLALSPSATLPQQPQSNSMSQYTLLPSAFSNSGDDALPWLIDPDLHDDILELNFSPFDSNSFSRMTTEVEVDAQLLHASTIQSLWFTYVPDAAPGTLYPESEADNPSEATSGVATPCSTSAEIDDKYRQRLQQRLKILSYEPTVPSVNLLNTWVRLYYSKVHPILPIIHAATFRPCRDNSSLLIAMCSVGSLFTGSDQGLRQGIHLFERVHKSTLQNWERLCAKKQDNMISIIQSAVISQMFGLLSGCPKLLLTVDAFHGPPVAWARQLGLHKARPQILLDANTDGHRLEEVWRDWARKEEALRLVHAVYIVDAELASLLHHEPLQNFQSYKFAFTSSEKAFMAPNARDWKEIYIAEMNQQQQHSSPPTTAYALSSDCYTIRRSPSCSRLTAYAILESIHIHILSQWDGQTTSQHVVTDHGQSLADFYRSFIVPSPHIIQDNLQLNVMWHSVCMTLFADFDLLERAVGRDGCKLSADEFSSMTSWSNSEAGLKCILHGLAIRMHVQSANRMSEFAMHVPRAIFWAALALLCYVRFGTTAEQHRWVRQLDILNSAELFSMGGEGPAVLSELSQPRFGEIVTLSTIACSMVDLLRHGGHWEIARKFAIILTAITNFTFHNNQR